MEFGSWEEGESSVCEEGSENRGVGRPFTAGPVGGSGVVVELKLDKSLGNTS